MLFQFRSIYGVRLIEDYVMQRNVFLLKKGVFHSSCKILSPESQLPSDIPFDPPSFKLFILPPPSVPSKWPIGLRRSEPRRTGGPNGKMEKEIQTTMLFRLNG